MKKKNIHVIVIIVATIVMSIGLALIAKDVKDAVIDMNNPQTYRLSLQYNGMIVLLVLMVVLIVSHAIKLYEHTPDMYKYDLPLALKNEYAEKVTLQQEKNRLYAAIIQALYSEYEIMYFAETETEDYLKYSVRSEDGLLWLDKHGRYFFTEIYRYLMKRADKSDLSRLSRAIKKENVLSELSDKGVLTVKFTSSKVGLTGYYMIKAVYFANKKSGHIVVGIKNITSSIQDENEYKEAVGQAIEMAVIDDLTGVKNRNAYVKHENELTVAAENDENIKFAIVILDVNGLKRVNDTMGHKAGDMLLRDAAKLICDVYKGNSIYRIGGDEFAVILMDDAYDNRDALLEEFRGRVTENMDSGAVTIASGLAVFQVETDIGAENVFERADAAMYLNKREMKNILVQKEEEQKAAKD
ncbi:MAG: GGDEF domain-containing protein [Clostridia bacterium]|nr:GGDEF domain-containing protein [Clostridia bacterium]